MNAIPPDIHLPDFLRETFGVSGAEARRLIAQGAVRLDGETVEDLDLPADTVGWLTIGQRRSVALGEPDVTRLDTDGPDFLDEITADYTAEDPAFPLRVELARVERERDELAKLARRLYDKAMTMTTDWKHERERPVFRDARRLLDLGRSTSQQGRESGASESTPIDPEGFAPGHTAGPAQDHPTGSED